MVDLVEHPFKFDICIASPRYVLLASAIGTDSALMGRPGADVFAVDLGVLQTHLVNLGWAKYSPHLKYTFTNLSPLLVE